MFKVQPKQTYKRTVQSFLQNYEYKIKYMYIQVLHYDMNIIQPNF